MAPRAWPHPELVTSASNTRTEPVTRRISHKRLTQQASLAFASSVGPFGGRGQIAGVRVNRSVGTSPPHAEDLNYKYLVFRLFIRLARLAASLQLSRSDCPPEPFRVVRR